MKLKGVLLLFKQGTQSGVPKPSGDERAARAATCSSLAPLALGTRHRCSGSRVCGGTEPLPGCGRLKKIGGRGPFTGAVGCPWTPCPGVRPGTSPPEPSRVPHTEGRGFPSAAGKPRGRAGATLPASVAPRGGAGRVAPGPLAKSGSEQPNPAPWARGGRGGPAGRAPLRQGAGGRAKLSSRVAARHQRPPRRALPAWAPTRCSSAPTAGRPPPRCCSVPYACSAGGKGTGAAGRGAAAAFLHGRGGGAGLRGGSRAAEPCIGPRVPPPAPPRREALSAPAAAATAPPGRGRWGPGGWRPVAPRCGWGERGGRGAPGGRRLAGSGDATLSCGATAGGEGGPGRCGAARLRTAAPLLGGVWGPPLARGYSARPERPGSGSRLS